MKVSEVFVPGGLPKHTYVSRAERGLEEKLPAAKDNLCKIATVTGATKSGKTVLVRKVFGNAPKVWVDGGHVKTEQNFWNIVGTQLEVVSELERSNIKGNSSELGAEATAEAGVETVEYEELRNALRAVLDEELPQAHEVSRVLEQMAKISSLDESSVPVIDYEKEERKLHVTDPFFAFFLRWGSDVMD